MKEKPKNENTNSYYKIDGKPTCNQIYNRSSVVDNSNNQRKKKQQK